MRRRHSVCDNCGENYYRRNLVEAWTSQNDGHSTGWVKTKRRVCTRCQPEIQTRRALIMVMARVLPKSEIKKRKKA